MNQRNQYDPFEQDPYGGNAQYSENPYGQDQFANNSQPYMHNQRYQQTENDSFDPYAREEMPQRNSYTRERSDPLYDGAYVNGQKEPEEEKKKHRFFFWLIFLLALLVFLYSAFQLFKIFKANWDERREKDRIIEIGNIPDDPEGAFNINWEAKMKIMPEQFLLIIKTSRIFPITTRLYTDTT